jgi:glutathione S-transferase
MKLYHCQHSRSLRVVWLAQEMGLDLEVHGLEFPPRAKEPDYFDVNPTATIPALVGDGVALFESIAILEFLAHRHGPTSLVVSPDEPDWPNYLQFLHMGEATLLPPLAQIVRYRMLETKERRLPQDIFIDRLQHVTARLKEHEFLAGERFTLADISTGYALHLADFLRLGEQMTPEASAYVQRMRSRPAFQRAFEIK